jgi:hypothetical protein
MPVKVAQAVRFYLEDGGRAAAVARAQREGRYEQVTDRWLLEKVHGRTLVMGTRLGD